MFAVGHRVLHDPARDRDQALRLLAGCGLLVASLVGGTRIAGGAPPVELALIVIALVMSGMVMVLAGRVSADRLGLAFVGTLTALLLAAHATVEEVRHALAHAPLLIVFASLIVSPHTYAYYTAGFGGGALTSRGIRLVLGYGADNATGSFINVSAGLIAFASALALLDRQHRNAATLLVQAADDANKAREEAEQAARSKGRFLANMSHELRTPMNAILGYSELLEDEVSDDLKPVLASVHKAGTTLLGEIDIVLESARREALGQSGPDDWDDLGSDPAQLGSLDVDDDLDSARVSRQRRLLLGGGLFIVTMDALAALATYLTGAPPAWDMVFATALVGAAVAITGWMRWIRQGIALFIAGACGILAGSNATVRSTQDIEGYSAFVLVVGALTLPARWFGVAVAIVLSSTLGAKLVRVSNGWTSLEDALIPWLGTVFVAVALFGIVTLRSRRQRALRDNATLATEARDRAARANRARNRFVAQMSHKVRTPLTTVLGYAEMLEEELEEASRPDATRIRQAGEHLLGIVDNVIDLQKVASGVIAIAPRPTDMRPLVDSVLDLCRTGIERNGNRVRVYEGPLPTLTIDPGLIRQILVNLMNNAGKFTRNGTVDLDVEQPTGFIVFHVRDTGSGISDADQKRLFQPFERMNIDPTIGGTGLGLTISRHMAELHGGTLTATSTLGEGSTFTLTLPR